MNSQLDDVNELLKLKQGDLVRLSHIKKTLESRNVLYISDAKYLQELTKAYLEDHTGERFANYTSYDYPEYSNKLKETSPPEPAKPVKASKPKVESTENSFCGNCGNSINDENYCPKCGHYLTSKKNEIKESEPKFEKSISLEPKSVQKNNKKQIGKKPLIVLGVLAVVIIAGAVALNGDIISLDNTVNEITSVDDEPSETISTDSQTEIDSDSKCGPGTVFDDATNSCILG